MFYARWSQLELMNHLSYVPISLTKENSILTPSCRPDRACASGLLRPPTSNTSQPALPAPPPSPSSPASPPRSGALHFGSSFPCCLGQESLLMTSDCWFWLWTHLYIRSCCLAMSASLEHVSLCSFLLPSSTSLLASAVSSTAAASANLRTVPCPKQLHKMIFWTSLISQSQHLLHILRTRLTDSWLLFLHCSDNAVCSSCFLYMSIVWASKQPL